MPRKKLISIPTSKINKMSKIQLLKQLKKSEYEKVFTAKTWSSLNARYYMILHPKEKLISIPTSKIKKMSEKQLLKQLAKAEYERVFTATTWNSLQARHNTILKKRNKDRT